jgi:superfamily I DNA/RNA helicase
MWRQVRGERGRERGREAFDDEMLGNQDFLDFVAAWWPPLEAADVLAWLRDGELLSRMAEGVLSPEEQRLLTKSWGGSDPSVEDVPLLDELRYALGDVPARTDDERELDDTSLLEGGHDVQELMTAADREYAPSGRPWSPPTHRIEDDPFAHVLIDEAQDLSPMQWRMVGRRGRGASWTIVGDPAQSSWPIPEEAASARAEALEGKELHEFHLSTNYRNSSEIYAHAAAYARRVGLDADLPVAVRSTGVEPRVITGVADLESATREAVLDSAGRVAGTVGIVVPVARRSEVNAWLASWPELAEDARDARAAIDSTVAPSGEDRVVVLTGLDTKGLEFDGIVVVRPEEIEAESATGRATLYVVFTRATQLLTTVS